MKITLTSDPVLTTLPREEVHGTLEGLLDKFEADYLARCRELGLAEGRLLQGERAILRDYTMWLAKKEQSDAV